MFGSLITWWYGLGWELQLHTVRDRLARWVDYFSFSIIIRTMFAPFRQISAGAMSGSLDVQFRDWLDRTISRGVGFVVRLFTLLFGGMFLVVLVLFSALQLIGWLVLPSLPALGIILSVIGWIPWQS